MAIKAIIFDFDGLILDTERHEYNAAAQIYRGLGVELPLAEWSKCIGTDGSAFDVYAYLELLVGVPVDRVKLRADRLTLFTELMSLEEVRPGVREYLQCAQSLDLRIGLASSSSFSWVSSYLELHQLTHYFETIRTKEDVLKVKPDPGLYQKALTDLGVLPSEAIAFEDSPNGALAAKRAGMNCVIVPNSITATLTFGETDLRLASMEQMSLPDVIKLMTKPE